MGCAQMFGMWRLLLACEVLLFHLLYLREIGNWAVISFFVLSGFLMTAVMQQSYGYSGKGLRTFAANRALRLYPSHWFACLFAVFLIGAFGEEAIASYHSAIFLPGTMVEWFQVLSLVYLSPAPIYVEPRLAPPTWALTIELAYYAAIAVGLSRSKTLALAWLAASAIYMLVAIGGDLGKSSVYGSIASGTFPFALGAATYHWREGLGNLLARWRQPQLALIAFRYLLLIATYQIFDYSNWRIAASFNVLNGLVSALLVAAFFTLSLSSKAAKADRLAGDYSYPVYLLHWQAGACASFLLFGEKVRGFNAPALQVFALAMVILAILTTICVFLIDRKVNGLRDKLRDLAIGNRGAGNSG